MNLQAERNTYMLWYSAGEASRSFVATRQGDEITVDETVTGMSGMRSVVWKGQINDFRQICRAALEKVSSDMCVLFLPKADVRVTTGLRFRLEPIRQMDAEVGCPYMVLLKIYEVFS